MIRIAICDDQQTILNHVQDLTEQALAKTSLTYKIDLFLSGEDLIKRLESGFIYHIALLDIEMGKLSGVDVGAILRHKLRHTQTLLIYISAYEARAKEVFYFDAIRFLSKPIDPKLFEEAILYACEYIKKRQDQTYTFRDVSKGIMTLPINDILYFDITEPHKIDIITQTERYTFYGSMGEIESRLENMDFLRIHQANLINFNHIRMIDFVEVIMDNNDNLKVSGARRKEVRRKYLQLRQRREIGWL